ncbi:unnamed protein product, partial [Oikopleura dioica]
MKTAFNFLFFGYSAHILEIDNNPPTFKTPCDWRAKAGCGIAYFDLTPEDADGDSISCRWSTMWEASEMAREKSHPNEAFYWDRNRGNCTLAYDSFLDEDENGKTLKESPYGRPIAIQVEDYSDGDYNEFWYESALAGGDFNIKSSMPLVFMAVVEGGGVDESHLLMDPNFDGLCAPSEALKTYDQAKSFCELEGGALLTPINEDDTNLIRLAGTEIWLNVLASGDKLIDQNTGELLNSSSWGAGPTYGPCGNPTKSSNVETIYVSATGSGDQSGVQCNVNQHMDDKKKFICTHPNLDCHSIPPSSCAISATKATYSQAEAICQSV